MYNLVADVDVHTRLYIIEGLLEVSGSGRSEVTGITVSLKEREKTIRSSSSQHLTDADAFNYQEREGSPRKRRVNKMPSIASSASDAKPKKIKERDKKYYCWTWQPHRQHANTDKHQKNKKSKLFLPMVSGALESESAAEICNERLIVQQVHCQDSRCRYCVW